jgi:flagellar M-ring protein FliF
MLLSHPAAAGQNEAANRLPNAAGAWPALAGAGTPTAALPTGTIENLLIEPTRPSDGLVDELVARRNKGPQRQLEQLVEHDEEQAAAILKQWIRQGSSA